jgi:hypothetical protein
MLQMNPTSLRRLLRPAAGAALLLSLGACAGTYYQPYQGPMVVTPYDGAALAYYGDGGFYGGYDYGDNGPGGFVRRMDGFGRYGGYHGFAGGGHGALLVSGHGGGHGGGGHGGGGHGR